MGALKQISFPTKDQHQCTLARMSGEAFCKRYCDPVRYVDRS